jgi:hypothetical protein
MDSMAAPLRVGGRAGGRFRSAACLLIPGGSLGPDQLNGGPARDTVDGREAGRREVVLMDCRLGLQYRRVAPNEELKLSACGGNGRTPGDGLEELAGCAGTGRSLTPER